MQESTSVIVVRVNRSPGYMPLSLFRKEKRR